MSTRMLAAAAIALGACGAPAPVPLANQLNALPEPESPPEEESCALAWYALAEVSPVRIPLEPLSALPGDDCPAGFAPATVLARCADCYAADLAPGRRGVLEVDGPRGSGRFASLGLVVDGPSPGFACATASTVGWRHLWRVHDVVAPLPWLADIGDDDATAELVVWQRLPWGESESENAMVPIVYELEGDALIRRDDRSAVLTSKMAYAYRRMIELDPHGPVACYRTVASALARWSRPHRRRR
jgi:hypothetical protein